MTPSGDAAARCRLHAEAIASFTCTRCGNFGCVDCERRVEANTAALCPSCWALRAAESIEGVAPGSDTTWQTAGLVMGVASFIPCCFIAVPAIVINIVAIVKAKQGAARAVRWRPIVGLCLSIFMLVFDSVVGVLPSLIAATRH
jgi:hypothetical protein